MELDIKKLEKAVCNLTIAITALTASINARKFNGHLKLAKPSRAIHNDLIDMPKTVCPDILCGVINSEAITCDHTLARYQSEYNCG